MTENPHSTASRAQAALDSVRLPEAARRSWVSVPPEPVAGQSWRARWADVAVLVLVIDVRGADVRVAPFSARDDVLDAPDAMTVSADVGGLASRIAIWIDAAADIPIRTLDRCITPANDALLEMIRARPRTGAGRAPLSEEGARLGDRLELLSGASWVPEGDGTLPELLRRSGVTPTALAELGVPRAQILPLVRGYAPLTDEWAAVLSIATGRPVQEWLAANPTPPPELVSELDRPTRRAQVDRYAERRGLGEVDAWRAVCAGTFALAARQTGPATAPDWRERVDHFLAGTIGE